MTTPISDHPENQGLPLQELSIMPDWTKSAPKSFEHHTGEDREPRRDSRGPRGPRREGGPRRDQPPRREQGDGARSPRRPDRDRDRKSGPRPGPRGPRPEMERKPAPPPVVPLEISFLPEEKGFTAMIETMKHSPRAYALFDVAKLVLNKPERHVLKISRQPTAAASRTPLFQVVADESLFLNQDDAIRHVFRRQMDKLCRQEKKPCDPPKGNFACVNRCGITGEIFGPPNYHEYQSLIVRHHQRRLRHMPFENFRSRIETSKDPEAIKQWIESRSFITEYHCALCAEPKTCASQADLEKHITETHLAQLITSGPELQITGTASRLQPNAGIAEALRLAWVSERRFPLKTAQTISDRLRQVAFNFFKHAKGVTYVSHLRLKRFETLDGLSDQIQKIITFLRANPDTARKQLTENLLGAAPDKTAEEKLLSDLHWLIQEGYVVEFADGRLWTQENRPPKPGPEPTAEPVSTSAPATGPTPVAAEVPSTPTNPPAAGAEAV